MHAGIENCRRHGRLIQISAVKMATYRSHPQNFLVGAKFDKYDVSSIEFQYLDFSL